MQKQNKTKKQQLYIRKYFSSKKCYTGNKILFKHLWAPFLKDARDNMPTGELETQTAVITP